MTDEIKKVVVHPGHHDKYVALPTDVTVEEWMLGDFNKNKRRNIDDPRPLDTHSRSAEKPNAINSNFTDPETNLSDQLIRIKKHNESYRPALQHFKRTVPRSEGRIKSVQIGRASCRERV